VFFAASFLSGFLYRVEKCHPAGSFGIEGCRFPVGFFGLKKRGGMRALFCFRAVSAVVIVTAALPQAAR
jgi:hypothetical protein